MKKLLIVSLLASVSTLALAKLAPPSDEANAKAAEAKAKAAWTGKVGAFKLCKAQDRVATGYHASAKAAGKEAKPAPALPACADPGAFSYAPVVAAKPLEASGAHSPAATAIHPPSSKTPAAAIAPAKKP